MNHPSEHRVYAVTFQSLERAFGKALTPQKKHVLRALGVDYDQPLEQSYPLEVWRQALNCGIETLFGELPVDEGNRAMGRRVLDSFGETMLGGMLFAMTRVMGPRRMLDRMARNMQRTNNYTELTIESHSSTHVVMHFNRVYFRQFYVGVMERSVEIANGHEPVVTYAAVDGERIDFDIQWQ